MMSGPRLFSKGKAGGKKNARDKLRRRRPEPQVALVPKFINHESPSWGGKNLYGWNNPRT